MIFRCVMWGALLLVAAGASAVPPAGYPSAISVDAFTLTWRDLTNPYPWSGYGSLSGYNLTDTWDLSGQHWNLANGENPLGTYDYNPADQSWTGSGPVITNIPEANGSMQIVGLAGFFLTSSRALRKG